RGRSYLWTVLNHEVGQGVLAWHLARAQARPLASALARCVLVGLHDLAVLLALGTCGALVLRGHRAPLPWVCGAALLGLVCLPLGLRWLPPRWRPWLRQKTAVEAWDRRHSLVLAGLRVPFYLILWSYVAAGLWVCGVPPDLRVVGGVIPLTLMGEALPSASGLGTRDTLLLGLLRPEQEQQAVILGFSLLWSTVLMTGRVAVGLVCTWLPETR